jgi:S-adenosylmethionine synthetase
MIFGYAVNETEDYMPLSLDLAQKILIELAALRRENKQIKYLRPDAKSQVTLEYDDNNKPVRIDAIVISTHHDDFDTDAKIQAKIRKHKIEILIPRVKAKYKKYAKLFNNQVKYHINPTGKFEVVGPRKNGDTGLTGRKIIVDTYGGKGAHGGGAFSGKDPSKVDRSAAGQPNSRQPRCFSNFKINALAYSRRITELRRVSGNTHTESIPIRHLPKYYRTGLESVSKQV